MDKHVTVLAIILIASGALGLLIAITIFWGMAAGALFTGDMAAMAVTSGILTLAGGFVAFLAIPKIIAGFGLLKRHSWGRILALVMSVISLLEIPVGTIIGLYGLWVLLKQETADIFDPPTAHHPVSPQPPAA